MSSSSTVLVADDDPDVLELLKVFLRSLDTRVITARDGEEALELARRELPDVALLDVQMPKKSGWEVCQALKSVQLTAGIGVVLITGRGEVKDRLTGLQVGADDYLVKPIHRGEVLKRVGDILARKKPRQPSTDPAPPEAVEPARRSVIIDPATSLPPISAVIDRLKERLGGQRLEVDWQFSLPVRMLGDGAWKIHLVDGAGQVLRLHDEEGLAERKFFPRQVMPSILVIHR